MSKKDRLMKIESFLKQSIFLVIGLIMSLFASLYDYILTNISDIYSRIFILDVLIYITILLILMITLATITKEYIKKINEIEKED